MKVAVLIDGGFFLKRAEAQIDNFVIDSEKTANLIFSYAMKHVDYYNPSKTTNNKNNRHKGSKSKYEDSDNLYRIFFYDCPPLEKKLHYPISKKVLNLAKSETYLFRSKLFEALKKKRKCALRLGYLAENEYDWILKPEVLKKLIKNQKQFSELIDSDFRPSYRQKAVDSKIAIDIASLSFKKQVDRIVLVAGDADFVPASKLARREGIDFILDPMENRIAPSLNEHIDGCHSMPLGRKSYNH